MEATVIPEAPAPQERSVKDVFCPHCSKRGFRRYIGAFVGRAQCKSCGTFVDIPAA